MRWKIIDSIEKVTGLARSMTFSGISPTVRKVTKSYKNGVTVAKNAMLDIEKRLSRKSGLDRNGLAKFLVGCLQQGFT